MMNTRTCQKPSLRPVLFMLCSESVRGLDRLAEAVAWVHTERSMHPDFRPVILSRTRFVTGCLFFLLLLSPGVFAQEWRTYGGDVGGTRFSALRQINRSNVGRLKRAWTYHMGEMDRGANETDRHHVAPFESTPLKIGRASCRE